MLTPSLWDSNLIECMSLRLDLEMSVCFYCVWMCNYGRWSWGGVEILGLNIYMYFKKDLDENEHTKASGEEHMQESELGVSVVSDK
jgi:hypothetical protein